MGDSFAARCGTMNAVIPFDTKERAMKAVYASTVNHADPLAALAVGEQPEPQARPFWSTVSVRAVTVNHHDVWSLQGVGLAAEQTPMILGTDAWAFWTRTSPASMAQGRQRSGAVHVRRHRWRGRGPGRAPHDPLREIPRHDGEKTSVRPPTCSPSPQASPRLRRPHSAPAG